MTKTPLVTQPDLSSRPFQVSCERLMTAPPHVLYQAWTQPEHLEQWAAAPGTALMDATVYVPFFFETHFENQRHPHYGRFIRLEPNRLVKMTWLNEGGTKGAETVVTIELTASGSGTQLRLTHSGLPDEESRIGHAQAWPIGLEHLDKVFGANSQSVAD